LLTVTGTALKGGTHTNIALRSPSQALYARCFRVVINLATGEFKHGFNGIEVASAIPKNGAADGFLETQHGYQPSKAPAFSMDKESNVAS
jgi:hypothetical protein